MSPIAAVVSIALSRYYKSWRPFQLGVVLGTGGDLLRGYVNCRHYTAAQDEVEARIATAQQQLQSMGQ